MIDLLWNICNLIYIYICCLAHNALAFIGATRRKSSIAPMTRRRSISRGSNSAPQPVDEPVIMARRGTKTLSRPPSGKRSSLSNRSRPPTGSAMRSNRPTTYSSNPPKHPTSSSSSSVSSSSLNKHEKSKTTSKAKVKSKEAEQDIDVPLWDGTYLGDGKDNIVVCVRIRPFQGSSSTYDWQTSSTSICEAKGASRPMGFEAVWTPKTQNREVFKTAVAPLVHQVLSGFNATFFCYGQTGSGKTHTIYGSPSDPGVCPLTIHSLFNEVKANPETLFLIRVSYMEIYNEEVHDLLSKKKEKLNIREAPNGFQVAELTETVVTQASEVFECIRKGNINRSVGQSYKSRPPPHPP